MTLVSKRFIQIAISGVFCIFLSAQAAQITVNLDGQTSSVEVQTGVTESAQHLGLGAFSIDQDQEYLSQTGQPALPFQIIRLLLCPDCDLSSIQSSLTAKYATLKGSWTVAPMPPIATRNENGEEIVVYPDSANIVDGYDMDVYGVDDYWPAARPRLLSTGRLQNMKLAEFAVPLYRYNSTSGQLLELSDADLTVTTTSDETAVMLNADNMSTNADRVKRVHDLTINYTHVAAAYRSLESYTDEQAVASPTLNDTGYVIITTNAIESASSVLDDFVAHKQVNYTVNVITEDQYGTGTGDTATENIRTWLQNNYTNTAYGTGGILYVLLIGDPRTDSSSVPMKMCIEDHPTDYFYGELSADWDADGDGIYGEDDAGEVEKYFEVYVGRIPYYGTISETDAILQKIMDYENETDTNWRRNALLPMVPLDDSTQAYQLGEQIKDNLLDTKNIPSTRIYHENYDLNPAPEFLLDDRYPGIEWSQGAYGMVFWQTHGWDQGASDVTTTSYSPLLDDEHPSAVFQGSCITGKPETTNNLGYSILKNGGIGTIAASRNGWYWVGQTNFTGTGASVGGLAYQYAKRIANQNNFGQAIWDTKEFMVFWLKNYYVYNLYGDPSVRVIYPESQPTAMYSLNGNYADNSGNGNTATGHNFTASQWSDDICTRTYYDLDKSLLLDGTDDYVTCPSGVAATDDLTIAFWIKPQSVANMIPLDKFPAGSTGAGWRVQLTQDGKVAFRIGSQSNYTELTTLNPVYQANRWVHIACTFKDTTAKIFINGQPRMIKSSITQTPNTSALNIQIGIPSAIDTDKIFHGRIDDVRFYDVALDEKFLNMADTLDLKPDNCLLAYLKLDQTSGTTAENTADPDNTATLYNDLSFANDSITGKVGKALSFDGTDDYASLATLDKRNNGFTVALWACPTAVKQWSRFIDFGNGEYSENIVLARYQNSNSLIFESYDSTNTGSDVIASDAIELDTWQFFAATLDTSGNVCIYKNGVLIQTGTSGIIPNTYRSNLYIGRSNWSSDAYYEGGMDDIRIYNYNLSASEIMDIYEHNRMDIMSPFSGATDVSINSTLKFIPADRALRHDIYFGSEYDAVLNADTQSPEYIGRKQYTEYNPASLQAWSEYFWRVDEILSDGTIQTGPVWRFSTIGGLYQDVWTGLSTSIYLNTLTDSEDYPDHSAFQNYLNSFDIPTNYDDGYGSRTTGLLVPQTTGSYKFWISGDDEVELWLSTDQNPANAKRIAYVHNASTTWHNFDVYSSQQSSSITLQAGQPYYVIALHKEGTGKDHLSVAWQGPDSDKRQVIDGFWLRPPAENEWPHFNLEFTDTFDAVEGQEFSASLPVTATDVDSDTITYIKQSGPGWLSVSVDGQLSGTPQSADAGSNTFTIRACDGNGGYDDIILPITVANRYTGWMGLDDLSGLAAEWLSSDPDSQGNLDSVEPVNLQDFVIMADQWNTGITDGLVAHWSFDENYSTIARDTYADFDGTLTNMQPYQWTQGVIDNALIFDGIDDYVQISDFNGITGSSSRTCTAWIKSTGSNYIIMSWGDNSVAGGKWVIRIHSDGTLRAEVQGGYIYGSTLINDGNWHHIAVVLEDDGSTDISEASLYVDGALDTIAASGSCSVDTENVQNVEIGTYTRYSGSEYFAGQMDDVRIYDTALTQQQISDIASADFQLHFDLDTASLTTVIDSSVYQRNGILMNSPTHITGYSGSAVSFDGVDDYIAVSGYKGVTGNSSRTCCAWVKSTGSNDIILSWGDYTVAGGKWVVRIHSNGTLRAEVQGGYIYGSTLINDGNWHHIAVVLEDDGSTDISEASLYVDGVLDTIAASGSCSVDTENVQNVEIGTYTRYSGSEYFAGQMDDIRIYNSALTENQIQEITGQ